MGQHPEQLLISAILRTGDFKTHQAHGITREHFHAYGDEWAWLERHFQTYGRTPTKAEFRNRFDEFIIKAVNTIPLYCAEVHQSHRRESQLELVHRILSDFEAGDPPDYEANEATILRYAARASLNGSRAMSLAERMIPGGSFILDGPKGIPAVWGHGQEVLWAEGEPLVIVGPEGVGKTTLAQQVALARIGIGSGKVLGFPVVETAQRLLYLAGDRPAQVRRSFARMAEDADRAILDDRLKVWPGPSPSDFGKHPGTLLDMARAADADTVIVDSLKDVARGLSDDETGQGVNQAHQLCVANGVEVCALHHQRKSGANGSKPTKLEDCYGSRWITAGSGSVILLWGEAGNAVVDLTHLKQPAEPVGPFRVRHDHLEGTSEVLEQADPVALADDNPITAAEFAEQMFSTDNPDRNQTEAARRRLERLVREGQLRRVEPSRPRDGSGHVQAVTYTSTGQTFGMHHAS